jgi:hypothetical protein
VNDYDPSQQKGIKNVIFKYKILMDACSFKESQYSISTIKKGVLVNYYTLSYPQKVKVKNEWGQGVMFALRDWREVGLINLRVKSSEPPRGLT